jgi:two-component system, cell cycle response regulator
MGEPAGGFDDTAGRRKSDPPKDARLRILAVDDDRSYLAYLRLVLTRAGFDVELAEDGRSAIERIRQGTPIDMLVVDLAMPGIDGIETVNQIQMEAYLPRLYTILLTANSGSDIKLRALESGLDDFLTKTSPESEILAKIRSAARRLEFERRLHLQNEELQTLALTDELTGIANRRALFHAGDRLLRMGRPLAVILFDLDQFKAINDTYGHLVGDRILADVGATFKSNTRVGDIIGRYGGDEFVLLMPDATSDEAWQASDRLLSRIRQLNWTLGDKILTINAQCGISVAPFAGKTLPELLASSDQALYRKKRRKSSPPEDRPSVQ